MKASQLSVTDPGNMEVAIEERAVGLDDRREQDGEAPHGEEVRQTRHGPLQQFALARDLDDFGVGDLAQSLPTSWRRLTRANEPRHPIEAPARDGEEDDRDAEADDDAS